jgi:hypothetical protein
MLPASAGAVGEPHGRAERCGEGEADRVEGQSPAGLGRCDDQPIYGATGCFYLVSVGCRR